MRQATVCVCCRGVGIMCLHATYYLTSSHLMIRSSMLCCMHRNMFLFWGGVLSLQVVKRPFVEVKQETLGVSQFASSTCAIIRRQGTNEREAGKGWNKLANVNRQRLFDIGSLHRGMIWFNPDNTLTYVYIHADRQTGIGKHTGVYKQREREREREGERDGERDGERWRDGERNRYLA